MQPLDIEQQLRLRQAQETTGTLASNTVPPLSYLHGTYQAAAIDAVYLFAGIPVFTATLITLLVLLARTKPLAHFSTLMSENHQRAGASLIVASTTPVTFTLGMAGWMVLLALQAVCNVLREVAQQHYRVVQQTNASALADLSQLHTLPVVDVHPHPIWGVPADLMTLYPPVVQWVMTPTAFIFATQYAGMACLWCYVLFAGHPLDAGMFAAVITFFPNFYQALLLDGNEPDRWPVWVTLVSFLLSLACLWTFGAPVVRREYRELKREMQGHTAEVLFKDRPEMRELRARSGRLPKKATKQS